MALPNTSSVHHPVDGELDDLSREDEPTCDPEPCVL